MSKFKLPMASMALLALAVACSSSYVRPTSQERVRSLPERLARGGYLVNQAMSCGACHSTREGGAQTGERADMYLAGSVFELPKKGIKVWIPNLTSDVETGLGGWSDDEIMRAVRDGVGKDGHLMFPLMPFSSFRYVSDEDLRAIVAYLRSVPPVTHARPFAENQLGFVLGFLVKRGVMHHDPAHDVPEPNRRDVLKYGEYVMRLGYCWECHSRTSRAPRDVGTEGFLSGWDTPLELPGVGKVYMRNLTPDRETGLGKYDAAQIARALREGRRLDGKHVAPPMSLFTPHLSGLSDEDMAALVAFLKSVPPVKNPVPERELLPAFQKALEGK